jgi:hypothetical protein
LGENNELPEPFGHPAVFLRPRLRSQADLAGRLVRGLTYKDTTWRKHVLDVATVVLVGGTGNDIRLSSATRIGRVSDADWRRFPGAEVPESEREARLPWESGEMTARLSRSGAESTR